jgi:hypothetical protein
VTTEAASDGRSEAPKAPPLGTPRRAGELFEVATVGLPFCVFKGAVGELLVARGWWVAGLTLLALAAVDAALNLVNLGWLALRGSRAVSECLLAWVARRGRAPHDARSAELGSALDVLLSFCLVAGMVALGGISGLPAPLLAAWNTAVVANVLGAGLSRLAAALPH